MSKPKEWLPVLTMQFPPEKVYWEETFYYLIVVRPLLSFLVWIAYVLGSTQDDFPIWDMLNGTLNGLLVIHNDNTITFHSID